MLQLRVLLLLYSTVILYERKIKYMLYHCGSVVLIRRNICTPSGLRNVSLFHYGQKTGLRVLISYLAVVFSTFQGIQYFAVHLFWLSRDCCSVKEAL